MPSKPIWQWSAVETAAAIRSGDITAQEAVDSALGRMRDCNEAVNAINVDLSTDAQRAARRADGVQQSGVALGPLHGVPITIKDNVDQAGQATTNGVPAFAEVIAGEDSPVVASLRKAGAIVIGRTNTPEFSLRWFTDNTLHGLTKNPWDETITPGGSSGGAAAAVSLGIGAIAHGTDLGGSLRYPAYACGLATIKPSLGRVPSFNPTASEERPPVTLLMSGQGPIAREVRDVRLALSVMAQGDSRDPAWVPAPLEGPRPAAPIKVAVTKDPAGFGCHGAVSVAIDQAADCLSNAGYVVEAADPPHVAEIAEAWRNLLWTETKMLMEDAMRQHGSDDINQVISDNIAASTILDMQGYLRTLADRTQLLRAWNTFMDDYDLVLAPVSQVPPYLQLEDLKGTDRVKQMLDEQSMLYAVNLLGLPSAAIPTGLSGGVPMGVQIIGQRFREDLCLDAAEFVERTTGILAEQLWSKA
jgi:amidase